MNTFFDRCRDNPGNAIHRADKTAFAVHHFSCAWIPYEATETARSH